MSKRFVQAKLYTEKYKSKLLPCKWCGNKDIRIASDRSVLSPPRNMWFVVCSTPYCDCTGNYTSVKKAIARWNEMQTPP